MNKKIVVCFLFLSIGIFAETTGYMLLTIDTSKYYKRTSSEVKMYENLVKKLDEICIENETQIGDMTVKAKEILLNKTGDKASCYELMKLVYDTMPEKMKQTKKVKYAEVIGTLLSLLVNSSD